jgi:hypothetical protein
MNWSMWKMWYMNFVILSAMTFQIIHSDLSSFHVSKAISAGKCGCGNVQLSNVKIAFKTLSRLFWVRWYSRMF